MRFLRLSIINYEKIFVNVNPPFYIDIGIHTGLSGNIPDSSSFALSTTGTVFMGLVDWAINGLNQRINYTITLSGLAYSIYNTANELTRARTSHMWYRMWACPDRFYNLTNACSACHFSCLTCTDASITTCLSCSTTDFRTLNSTQCTCNAGYK